MSLSSSFVCGQVLVASGVDASQSHGWAVYPSSHDEILLVHLPPRDVGFNAQSSIAPAVPGQLQTLRTLSNQPEQIAAIGDRVYMVFPQVALEDRRIRRVFSGRVSVSPVGSVWGIMPNGKLDTMPSIEGEGELVDFVATSRSLWALIRSEENHTLLTLGDNGWSVVELPSVGPIWRIVAAGDELVAVDASDSHQLRAYARSPDQQRWDAWGEATINDPNYTLVSGAKAVYVLERDAVGALGVASWSRIGWFVLAAGLDVPADAQFSALGSVNRLLAFSIDADSVRIDEIDLLDGSVLYSGEPTVSVAVSTAEMRFLMGMMVLIMIGVLVVVLMPDRTDAMGLPDGFELADPGRRLMATMFDVVLVCFGVGLVFDVRMIEILTLSVIARTDTSWLVVPVAMISGIGVMSVMEWLWGASPGKLLVGLRLVRAQSGAMQRVPLWAAVVRNVIKWLLPPVAAFALVDPEMLHRGDRATRTLVCSVIEDFEPSGSPPGSDPDD